jgi:hypothetical protein
MSKNKIITVCLVIFCLVIILPPIIHGYIYANLGDDTARHLNNIYRMQIGQSLPSYNYNGFIYIGYPMALISRVFDISELTLFMAFNCLILLFIGIVLFVIITKLINWKVGLLALVIPIFVSGGMIEYAYWGVIFNLINVAILIPTLIYFISSWLNNSKNYKLFLIGIFTILVSTFHTSGIYLPFAVLFGMAVFLIYKLIKKERDGSLYKPLILGTSILCVSLASMVLFAPEIIKQPYWLLQSLFPVASQINPSAVIDTSASEALNTSRNLSISLVPYLIYFITIPAIALLILSIIILKSKWNIINYKTKVFLFSLVSMLIVLGVAAFCGVSNDPTRQQVDFSIILSIITLVLVCLAFQVKRNQSITFILVIIIGVGCFYHLPTWFNDNSAIKTPDKQAIEYVNTLEGNYDCSSTVAFWIYNHYTDGKYVRGSDILIVRDIPMTPGSTKGDAWFDSHGTNPDDSYKLDKTFSGDKVKVSIYEKIKP